MPSSTPTSWTPYSLPPIRAKYPSQPQLQNGSADTSVVLNPYEFDWQWQTEDGQTSTSQVDGFAADGSGALNETVIDARIPSGVDAFAAFSVNPTSVEIERQPLVKGDTAKVDPQADGEDVPYTLGDDGTTPCASSRTTSTK